MGLPRCQRLRWSQADSPPEGRLATELLPEAGLPLRQPFRLTSQAAPRRLGARTSSATDSQLRQNSPPPWPSSPRSAAPPAASSPPRAARTCGQTRRRRDQSARGGSRGPARQTSRGGVGAHVHLRAGRMCERQPRGGASTSCRTAGSQCPCPFAGAPSAWGALRLPASPIGSRSPELR